MRLNATVGIGALIFVFGAFIIVSELFQGGGGGGIFGAILAGPILIVFGIVLMNFGSKPKRFTKRS